MQLFLGAGIRKNCYKVVCREPEVVLQVLAPRSSSSLFATSPFSSHYAVFTISGVHLAGKNISLSPFADPPTLDYENADKVENLEEPAVVGNPWRMKGPAQVAVLLMTCEYACLGLNEPTLTAEYAPRQVGSNFASSSISPLKSTIRKELGINNAQYAVVNRFSPPRQREF
jgi:hypothetical protein